MKFERINENQIRCTLNKADLADRELLINELAYGTEKAKALFREMMQQASYEVGFEAEDIPLMIEAIPVSPDCLVLIITKVEDPEELDTRFSKFTKPPVDEEANACYSDEEDDDIPGAYEPFDDAPLEFSDNDAASEALDFFSPISNAIKKAREAAQANREKEQEEKAVQKVFLFRSMRDILKLAPKLHSVYREDNSLYRDHANRNYYLLLTKGSHQTEAFGRICNFISEYGQKIPYTYASAAYYKEHYDTLMEGNAIKILSEL